MNTTQVVARKARTAVTMMSSVVRELPVALDPRHVFGPIADARLDDTAAIGRSLGERGWSLVRDVLTPDEVAELRRGVLRSKRDGRRGDLLSNPELSWIVSHPRVAALARAITDDRPVYFGDSCWTADEPNTQAFHKDNPDRVSMRSPDWQSPYTVVRVGLYLQDHERHSGGLAIREGSQNTLDLGFGRPIAVPTRLGDAAVWTLRTSHAGFAVRPRGVPGFLPPFALARVLTVRANTRFAPPRLLFQPLDGPHRLAVFMTFARPDAHLDRYLRYLLTRRYAVETWRATEYTDEARTRVRGAGLRLLEMRERAVAVDPATVHDGHAELPDAR